MEQKTLLAIILSVAILFGYEAIFVAPKKASALKTSQTIVSKEDTTKNTTVSQPVPGKIAETNTGSIKEELWSSRSTISNVELTNVGGSIHNVHILTGHPMPLTGLFSIRGYESVDFKLISNDPKKLVLAYQDTSRRIVKTFNFKDEHAVLVNVEVSNLQSMSRLENIEFNVIKLDFDKIDSSNKRETMLDEYSVSVNKKIARKGGAFKFEPKESRMQAGAIDWAGFRDHYSVVVVHPEFETKEFEIKQLTEKSLAISVKTKEENIAPGASVNYQFMMYAGPQDVNVMKKYGKGIEQIVAFFNWNVMDALAKAIFYTIPFLQMICKSWGLSIILISLIIYGLTYPLTIKSMMSMKKMQQTQPKIKALQERYKSDPQKLNAEIMEIYKREKINPLGGCLPFLLQMPIFIALYQALWRASYFQGKGFLWIKDLTMPDRLFIMPFSIPFLGNEFNLLPILMAIVMFAQQKISAKSMTITDEQQAMQQKMMMYFFPVFIGFIFYKFASGLSLYFTVFYLLSTLTQWKMGKVK